MSESQLRRELKRRRPFCTPQQEAVLRLLRTSDQLENRLVRFFRRYEN
jgi:MarR family transcriptional regulator, 2-MHQ and catechol-resistance regulon repressor